jgi:hypothetical protein
MAGPNLRQSDVDLVFALGAAKEAFEEAERLAVRGEIARAVVLIARGGVKLVVAIGELNKSREVPT